MLSRSCTVTAASAAVNFYLDTARSTDNDYYFEGAFAISSDYRQGEPLRLEALEPGKTTVRADGRVPQRRFWQSICRNFSRCRT